MLLDLKCDCEIFLECREQYEYICSQEQTEFKNKSLY